jgi:hypothetical protein
LNIYQTTLDGADYDIEQSGTNSTSIFGGILVNNTTNGTITYGGTIAADAFTGTITNATNVSMLNETADTTTFIAFVTDSTPGNFPLKTDTNLTYNSNTGLLTATGFAGPLTGNADTATTSTNVIAADTESATAYISMHTAVSGVVISFTDEQLTYDASTGILTAAGFSGPLTGNVTGNVSGTAATVTGATQAAITTTANLTTVGALTSGSLAAGFTDVPVAQGGTGASTFALNGILYGNGASAIGATAIGAEGQMLRVGADPFVPAWSTSTFADTYAIGTILHGSAANTVTGLAWLLERKERY